MDRAAGCGACGGASCGASDGPPSGILNVDKPAGMTSHDVVNAVRKIAGTRRVGHAGTLDPMATGVLLICVGQATRIAEYVMQSAKTYIAEVRFGQATTTYDAEGDVVGEYPTAHLTAEGLKAALAGFVGPIRQRAPAFSAVKQGGEPLYRRARRGESVEPPVREVHIYRAEMVRWEPPVATVEVECSPGTYIRSLAHDWGQLVGSGAHLTSLRRVRSGRFSVEDAVPLARLQEAAADGDWERFLIPMDEALLDMPALILTAEQAQALEHGQPVEAAPGAGGQLARAYTLAGDFVALVCYNDAQGRWLPAKVFRTR
ncbi:MAG: tRNA pseudouridine(55) synthase TruB [Anaerolineales bacterium]